MAKLLLYLNLRFSPAQPFSDGLRPVDTDWESARRVELSKIAQLQNHRIVSSIKRKLLNSEKKSRRIITGSFQEEGDLRVVFSAETANTPNKVNKKTFRSISPSHWCYTGR